MKKIIILLTTFILIITLSGCSSRTTKKETTITIAAASSLKNCMDDKLIPLFEEKYPDIKLQTTYDSSGKLQRQIEEGAPVDIFFSAAMKQMTALDDRGLIIKDSIVKLLENKIVFIIPMNSNMDIETFEDIQGADKIAIGDPASVPAGQYGKEVLTNLSIWDKVSNKLSLGTNVTEVLNWVAEGSADAGIVYSTDATANSKVKVVATAPEGSVSKVIYPVGIVKATKEEASARKFIEFLQSEEAKAIFEQYGFTIGES